MNYINFNDIEGVVWLSGGQELSLVQANVTLDSRNVTADNLVSSQVEIISGPAGADINSDIRFTAVSTTGNTKMSSATWSYTEIECDPIDRYVVITFIDEEGNILEQLDLDLNKIDLGLPVYVTFSFGF